MPAFRAGGPIQSVANLVREYRGDVEYYIFTSDTDLTGGALGNVATGEWVRFNDVTHVWYADHEKISDSLVKQVEKIKPDIIYIIGIWSWHFNVVPLAFCKGPIKILSARGMLHPGAMTQKKWKKKFFLTVFKLMEYHYKTSFHATDDEEEKYIRGHFGDPPVIYKAGNFRNIISDVPVLPKEPGTLHLVSVALVSPMKNILHILAALMQVPATVVYDIYGPVKDTGYWEQCKQLIRELQPNITARYNGEIEPPLVKLALQQAHVAILPSKSENFGHAIYEALSAGRPVITSHTTPWNDLEKSSAGLNVEPSAGSLADAINFFAAMDQQQLAQWSEGARTYAANAVDIETIRSQYKAMFGSAITGKQESESKK